MNWLFTGIVATLLFAFFGFFSKLSIFYHPVISSLTICGTAAISGIILGLAMERSVSFSGEAFLSGIFSSVGMLTMLYMLISNQVLVVFSFVSFASVIFFLIMLAFEKPDLSRRQESFAVFGILVSVVGLFLASTSAAGGFSYLLTNSSINPYFLIVAPVIPLGSGLWAYFSFVAIKKLKVKVPIAVFNYSLASLMVAATAYLFFGLSLPAPVFSGLTDFFPVIAGLFVMAGVVLTLKSFEMTSGKSRIEETIVAILANAEIVPLIFLSYFILREFTVEGFVGASTVFVGLVILNFARVR
jgi:hypothetical protein